jgi:hypothetical protein
MTFYPDGPSDGEMRAALEELPPGHPSSAWNTDGTRRPPPPRLHDLELPLPGAWGGTFDDEPAAGPVSPAAATGPARHPGPAGCTCPEPPVSDDPQNDAATGEPPARGDAS